MKPVHPAERSYAAASVAPIASATSAAVEGNTMSGVTVATMTRSTSLPSTPACASASRAAGSARSESASSAAAIRRSRMPVRSTIHSSEVSTYCESSSFFTTRSGTLQPSPVMETSKPALAAPIIRRRRRSGGPRPRARRRRSRGLRPSRWGRARGRTRIRASAFLPEPRTPAVRVALRGADGHARRLGDLLERVAHRVLEHDHLCLARGDLGERVAELASQLRHAGGAYRIGGRACMHVILERLVHAGAATLRGVPARVHDETVQPRRELRVAAELRQPDAHLRERLLRSVAGVFRIAEEMARQPLDPRGVPGAERLERTRVAVLRPRDEDRGAPPLG